MIRDAALNADDIVLRIKDKVQRREVISAFAEWGLRVNEKKTKKLFEAKNGADFQKVKTYKCLGRISRPMGANRT